MFKLHNGYEYFILYLINKNNNIDTHFNFISDIRCYLFSILYNLKLSELNSVC